VATTHGSREHIDAQSIQMLRRNADINSRKGQ